MIPNPGRVLPMTTPEPSTGLPANLAPPSLAPAELYCIDLDLPGREGFRRFISAWLYRDAQLTFVVDPGPLATLPLLLTALRRCQVERLDLILLTHIHIDHAGATGALLREFPQARVVCHAEGVRHLVAPEKLWQGSLKVLGELAQDYGEIVPVAQTAFVAEEQWPTLPLQVVATPGHAVHHQSYLLADLLFAGEVAGVRSPSPAGLYMRPATPPRFDLAIALASVERVLALQPQSLVFAHYGLVPQAQHHLRLARRQLLLWVQGCIRTADLAEDEQPAAFWRYLLTHDAEFARFGGLAADIQARERYFFSNSHRGMRDYVAGLNAAQRAELLARPLPSL